MKKTFYFLLFSFCALIVNAHPAAQQGPKEVLKIIRLAYEAWNNSNGECMKPDTYITAADGKIVGQKFFTYIGDDKYVKIMLDWKDQSIVSAMERDYKINLQWSNGQVAGIKVDGLHLFDYAIHYNDKGDVADFTCNQLLNNRLRFIRMIEMEGDRITKITAYENEVSSSTPWIRSIKTFTYGESETNISYLVYATGKSNNPKNIISNMTAGYKKTGDKFITAAAWGDNIETVYNANDKISAKKVVTRFGKTEEHGYTYLDGKMFKEETVTTGNNGFYEKNILIYFTLTDKPASTPDYEKTQGRYLFSKDGELIWESRDSKYRKKVNGVWSEWEFFRM